MRIIIEGNVGAGKSTSLTALEREFPTWKVQYEPVEEWQQELELFYKAPSQWSLPLSLRVLLAHHRSAAIDNLFIERCPLSCRHVFTQQLFNEGTMPQHHWDLFREYYDLVGWEPSEANGDLIIYIDTPVDKCMTRVSKRARQGEEPLDVHYLRKLEFQYQTMLRYCACPVKRVDGSGSPEEVAAQVVSAVKHHLLQPLK